MINRYEIYMDLSYYDLWAVRDCRDKSFKSPRLFHFMYKKDAEAFKELLEKSI